MEELNRVCQARIASGTSIIATTTSLAVRPHIGTSADADMQLIIRLRHFITRSAVFKADNKLVPDHHVLPSCDGIGRCCAPCIPARFNN